MNLRLFLLALSTLCISCADENQDEIERSFRITGEIEALKKGVIYLERIQDSALIAVDSARIDGDGVFDLSTPLSDDELLFIYLDKNDGIAYDDRWQVWGSPGTSMSFKWHRDSIEKQPRTTGSAPQQVLEDFIALQRFHDNRALRTIQDYYIAKEAEDVSALEESDKRYSQLEQRRALSMINFALTHSDSPVAPYVAMSELRAANPKYLDTIYKKLAPSVRASHYGVVLKEQLESID